MNDEATTKLQQAALDDSFVEWVRDAVRRFAKDYDLPHADKHKGVLREYDTLFEDFLAGRFPNHEAWTWEGASESDVEHALREDFENTAKFRETAAWSKDGSQYLSCGRDLAGKPIDLQTLTEDARRTLVALYLMSLGDSALLVTEAPDWDAWRDSDDPVQSHIACLVFDLHNPRDGRFERIGLVVDCVLSKWNEIPAEAETDDALPKTPPAFDDSTETLFRDAIKSYKPNQWKTGVENTRKTMGKVNAGTQAGWIFGSGTEAFGFANRQREPLVAKKNEDDAWQTLIATSRNEKTLAFFKLFPPEQFKMLPSRLRDSDA